MLPSNQCDRCVALPAGDGYFATWACFLVSCAFIYQEVAFYRGQLDALKDSFAGRGARLRGLLFIASIVVIWESSYVCTDMPRSCNNDADATTRLARLGLVNVNYVTKTVATEKGKARKDINFCVKEYGWAVACSTISGFVGLCPLQDFAEH